MQQSSSKFQTASIVDAKNLNGSATDRGNTDNLHAADDEVLRPTV
jgi:hypothetical protein